MYESLFKNALFPFYESTLRRRPTLAHLKVLEERQWQRPEQILEVRWEKLGRLLKHTYEHVPYYRRQWDAIGVKPQDIRTPEDYAKLPLLTKSEIRICREGLEADDYRGRNIIKSGTGGSTGESLRFSYARDSYEWRIAGAARSDRWAGWDFGCREAHVWGLPLVPPPRFQRWKKALHNKVVRRRFFNSYDFSEKALPGIAEELNRWGPDVVIGYSQPLYLLARCMISRGIKPRRPVRGVIATAEMLYDFQRPVIEQAFGCRVTNRYGCREVMLIAAECEKHEGLHINADNVYVEFVKPDGSACAPGEQGAIVLTDLNNYGMPFIRYKVGDLGVPTDRMCSCGRGLPLMDAVKGRTLDVLRLPDGRHLTGLFFTHLLLSNDFPGLESYQFEQTKPDHVLIRIVPGPGWTDASFDAMRRIIGNKLGESLTVSFQKVEKIPLTASGKWRPVIGLPAETV